MATLYLAEFVAIGGSSNHSVQGAFSPPLAEQTVAIAGSHAESAPFNANTNFVRINVDAICSIAFGANPAATANNMRFAANQTEYFSVTPGQKLSVISNT
jgi:hypothetical protein